MIKNNLFIDNHTGIWLDPASPQNLDIDYNAYIGNEMYMVFSDATKVKFEDLPQKFPFWGKHSFLAKETDVKDMTNRDFRLSSQSTLRGKGWSGFSNPLVQFVLGVFRLNPNIGPW